jgi:protein tyrosine phosphatase
VSKTKVGKCIKIAQEKRDITTMQMARDFNVHRQQVQRWRASDDMRLHKIEEFAEYFRMSRDEFLRLGD